MVDRQYEENKACTEKITQNLWQQKGQTLLDAYIAISQRGWQNNFVTIRVSK